MKAVSINTNPSPWQKEWKNDVRIVSLNCAGLAAHFTDILCDEHLLKANIIHLIETSINMENEAQFKIEGFKSHFVSVGNGKGLVTFFRLDGLEHNQDVKETNMQISKFSSPQRYHKCVEIKKWTFS